MRVYANVLETVHLSRFNAKYERCVAKGVKCVLSCQLWLHIYVQIVNKFVYTYFYIPYSDHITYDVLLILPKFFDYMKCHILCNLCKNGALIDLIKIHDLFEWSIKDVRSNNNEAFLRACAYDLDVAKWLFTEFQLTVGDARSRENFAFRYACQYGHLNVAKWLYTTFQLTVVDARSDDNYAFRYACRYGRLDVAQWLCTTFQLTVDDVRSSKRYLYRLALLSGHQDVCDWLITTFGKIFIA